MRVEWLLVRGVRRQGSRASKAGIMAVAVTLFGEIPSHVSPLVAPLGVPGPAPGPDDE
jgi:hypothetical protein